MVVMTIVVVMTMMVVMMLMMTVMMTDDKVCGWEFVFDDDDPKPTMADYTRPPPQNLQDHKIMVTAMMTMTMIVMVTTGQDDDYDEDPSPTLADYTCPGLTKS